MGHRRQLSKGNSMPVVRPKSKILRPILLILASSALILQIFTNVDAQDIEVAIKIGAKQPYTAEVDGKFLLKRPEGSAKFLTFLTNYAGIAGLGERYSQIGLYDHSGVAIGSKRLIAGEYIAESAFGGWSYRFYLEPLSQPSAAAHLSWIEDDSGLIMLDDLLPQLGPNVSARVSFDLPAGWTVSSNSAEADAGRFNVADIEKAVFYIGRKRREKLVNIGETQLKIGISGAWLFTDDEAAEMATSVFTEYKQLFGSVPNSDVAVDIRKYPIPAGTGNWEADTRGASVTIISADMPFKTQSLQRLHEQLRHEIFHLWIPNGINLSGNYDWFYEGFALYQSLKLGVDVNRIRFDDFLDTLSRVYDIDAMQSAKISLIDASTNRWTGSNTRVYARGMIVAFMCDLALLEKSKGKRAVPDLLREIYTSHRPPNQRMNGNDALVKILQAVPELKEIAARYIVGSEIIEWTKLLNAAGIDPVVKDQLTKLTVTPRPSGRQKELLNKLGYNNWRKLSKSKK